MLATKLEACYIVAQIKRRCIERVAEAVRRSAVSEIWETIDDLFRTVNRQSRRVAELEARLARLEQNAPESPRNSGGEMVQMFPKALERPLERAA